MLYLIYVACKNMKILVTVFALLKLQIITEKTFFTQIFLLLQCLVENFSTIYFKNN